MSSSGWSKSWIKKDDYQYKFRNQPYILGPKRHLVVHHYLLADKSEKDPRNNHIHIKYVYHMENHRAVSEDVVACSVTIKGRRVFSRKVITEKINSILGTNFKYNFE